MCNAVEQFLKNQNLASYLKKFFYCAPEVKLLYRLHHQMQFQPAILNSTSNNCATRSALLPAKTAKSAPKWPHYRSKMCKKSSLQLSFDFLTE